MAILMRASTSELEDSIYPIRVCVHVLFVTFEWNLSSFIFRQVSQFCVMLFILILHKNNSLSPSSSQPLMTKHVYVFSENSPKKAGEEKTKMNENDSITPTLK